MAESNSSPLYGVFMGSPRDRQIERCQSEKSKLRVTSGFASPPHLLFHGPSGGNEDQLVLPTYADVAESQTEGARQSALTDADYYASAKSRPRARYVEAALASQLTKVRS